MTAQLLIYLIFQKIVQFEEVDKNLILVSLWNDIKYGTYKNVISNIWNTFNNYFELQKLFHTQQEIVFSSSKNE